MSGKDIFNIVIGVLFVIVGIVMLLRWTRVHKYIMIKDQQWGYLRIFVLFIGLLSIATLLMNAANNTTSDYFRIGATLVAVTAFLAVHDGVGEQGIVSSGKFIPWTEIRSWDLKEEKNYVAAYFTVESQDEKKPDEYTTKELDFANEDKEYLKKFLEMNVGRKYTRMKKKSK
ncbi:MAG: hypothetical protein E7185_12180 [Erysipelotrichaceae bacterium]|nr:hypothetical protein [Erysipelotrichaceae bacterium]